MFTFAWVGNHRSGPLLVPLAGDAKGGIECAVVSLERLTESLALVAEGNQVMKNQGRLQEVRKTHLTVV